MTQPNKIKFKAIKAIQIKVEIKNGSLSWQEIDDFLKISFKENYRGLEYTKIRSLERNSTFICGYIKQTIVACAIIRPSGKKDGTIVHPSYRNQGIGRKLIQYSFKHFPNQCAIVNSLNQNAIKLFIDCGFKYEKKISKINSFLPIYHRKDICNIRELKEKLVFDRHNKNMNLLDKDLTALVYNETTKSSYHVVYLPGKISSLKEGKSKLLRISCKELDCQYTVVNYKNYKSLKQKTLIATGIIEKIKSPLIICGSSLGGYIALKMSNRIKNIASMILFSPAINIDGYPKISEKIKINNIKIIHGYNDKVVPCKNVVDFCTANKIELRLLNDGHKLSKSSNIIIDTFKHSYLSL